MSTWPKETQPQNILRIILGIPTLIILGLSYWPSKRQNRPNDSSITTALPWKYHSKISLSIGSYHDVLTKKGDKYIRITLKDISQINMPPIYESTNSVPDEIKTEVAAIGFDPGFFVYHGTRVKKVISQNYSNEYCFYMCKNEEQEERNSVYFFTTEHVLDGEFFFRCFVDHINPVKKEVELNIYFLWTNDSRAALSKPIEPASASSAPEPDDYHAPRRSFFHSDNDRPRRS